MKWIAVIAYSGTDAFEIQLDYVGSYSDKKFAEQAVDLYKESTLEVERSGYTNFVAKYFLEKY